MLLFGLLVLLPLEYLFALRPGRPAWRRWLVDLQLLFVNGFAVKYPAALVLAVLLGALEAVVPAGLRQAVQGQPIWLQALEILIVADLAIYLAHRAFHHPALWRYHAVHHSAEELDWLVAYRAHPVEVIAIKVATFLPVFALGFSSAAIAVYAAAYAAHAMLVHSNMRLRLGPLRHVIVGPEFHHWHHADDRTAYDRNFGAVLPVWDRLFGTLHEPVERYPSRYGAGGGLPSGALGLILHPLTGGGTALPPTPSRNAAPARGEGGATSHPSGCAGA